jgi:Zn-dependent M28 family amino/carboxypeptidase
MRCASVGGEFLRLDQARQGANYYRTAEEAGLLGAEFYVKSLNQTEKDKIRLLLDFDMMASPNYAFQIYDGDGSAFNLTGPAGSAEAEAEFA